MEFRRHAEAALDSLKQHLIEREEEDDAGFEVEEQNGVLNVLFDNPPGKFVITPNTPVRQIWISALATSFKLDWDAEESAFVLPRTGEALTPLLDRLMHHGHLLKFEGKSWRMKEAAERNSGKVGETGDLSLE